MAASTQADEAPVQAEKPIDEKPVTRVYGPVPTGPMPGGYGVVGDYRVGRIHEPRLAHLFWYSAYNPYLDELHAPFREAVYGGRHARYYTGYRSVYTPNWDAYYVPQTQCYAPGAYGYNAYGAAPANPGFTQPYTSYYGPGSYGAATPGGYLPPPADINVNGFRYTGDPSVYSPYGVGSSSYFGAYGSAGY